jgi:hypothetical protein
MLLFGLLVTLLLSNCHAYPTVLIESARLYCYAVEAAQDTVIRVHYNAPGESRVETDVVGYQ